MIHLMYISRVPAVLPETESRAQAQDLLVQRPDQTQRPQRDCYLLQFPPIGQPVAQPLASTKLEVGGGGDRGGGGTFSHRNSPS